MVEILVTFFFSWSSYCFLSFFLSREHVFFLSLPDRFFSLLLSWSKASFLFFYFLVFFYKFPPQGVKREKLESKLAKSIDVKKAAKLTDEVMQNSLSWEFLMHDDQYRVGR